jgi:hypothetical protein
VLVGLLLGQLSPLFLAFEDLVRLGILIKDCTDTLLVPDLPIVLDLLCPLGHKGLLHEFLRNSDICQPFVGWTKETLIRIVGSRGCT